MRKVIAIAHREFNAMVGTKAFVFSLVMMPILMVGGMVAVPALSKIGGVKERKILVADSTGDFFESIQAAAEVRNKTLRDAKEKASLTDKSQFKRGEDPFSAGEIWTFERTQADELDDESRLKLSDRIRDGKLYAFVEIRSDFRPASDSDSGSIPETGNIVDETSKPAMPPMQFVSQDAMLSGARRWLENHVRNEVRRRNLNELGIDPSVVQRANVPVSAKPIKPYKRSADGKVSGKDGAEALASMFLPFGIMMLMFVVIFMAAQPMLESGMEEKNARIAELLLGSVTPTQLMSGKLLGNVAGSFVIFAVYAVGAWFVANQNDLANDLPWSLLPWMILFQVLGVLFFSSIFLAIGASVSELKEAQSMLLPVWLLLMIPMFVWFLAVKDPNGVVPVTLSFFPPSAPMMMSLRMGTAQTLPAWHAPASALVMLVATCTIVLLAARVYRASLLKSDSVKSFSGLIRRFWATT